MKRVLLAVALGTASSLALADVGVSISVGQPGFYGQIELGDAPAPQVINAQPVIIQQVQPDIAPVYLHVPPGYERHWRRHCAAYNACGRPVYFVDHNWYNNVYVPHYQQHPEAYHHDDHRGGWDHDHPGGDHDHHDHGDDHDHHGGDWDHHDH